jgi:hypothetical protein
MTSTGGLPGVRQGPKNILEKALTAGALIVYLAACE